MIPFFSPRAVRTGTLALLAALGLAPHVRAQTTDPTFGSSGSVTTTVGDASTGVRILTQTDDALVVAGFSTTGTNTDGLLLRYQRNGTLDPAFGGGDGIVTTDFGGQDVLQALARQADGTYVVAGYTSSATGFLVARYLADGTLDPSFSGDGWTVVSVGGFHDEAHDVLVLPSGEIVVAGFSAQNADVSNTQWAVVRLTATGDLDATFASGGVYTHDFGGVDVAYRLGRDSQGRLLVTGLAPSSETASDFTVLRLTAGGSNDASFGTAGVASLAVSDGTNTIAHSFALAVTPTDAVVVGGAVRTASGDPSVAVAKFTSGGMPDASFGGGNAWTAIPLAVRDCPAQSCEQFNAVRLQDDGKILGAGFVVTEAGAYEHVTARFESDGTPDTAFDDVPPPSVDGASAQAVQAGDGAIVSSGTDGVLTDLALQPDNKLVTTGSSVNGIQTTRVETGQALPVELTAFAAALDGSRARLTWTTASETNNAGFAVEQKVGETWAERGFVSGHGTTTERHDYAFQTGDLPFGRHSFRLRQGDLDGSVHYSAVVEVFLGVTELRVGRTPSGLYLWVPEEQTADVYDLSGRRVRSGLTTGRLDTDGMAAGMYFVRTPGKTVPVPVLR